MRATTSLALFVALMLFIGAGALTVQDRSDKLAATDHTLTTTASDQATRLEEYFARARSINLITAHNPAFTDFYAAPGSRTVKIRDRAAAIRASENALAYLEQLYPSSIGEACFIDATGPENARFVYGARASFRNLSPNERGNPFFTPTFALRPGEVYQAKPYVSPDTHTWVISNSTPLPGTGYPAKAIVHFEITLASFRDAAAALAKGSEIAVVDAQTGQTVFDTASSRVGPVAIKRFEQLASVDTSAGTTNFEGHRGAFRHLLTTAHNANDWYVVAVDPHAAPALLHQAGFAPLGMALAGAALILLAGISLRSARRSEREEAEARRLQETHATVERDYHVTQREFTEIMQITRDEDEAYKLLARHLERSLPDSEVLVMNRNNSHDRLEAMTDVPEGSPLNERLRDAEPDSCLAVRLGKTHERSPDNEPLLVCELCGVIPSKSTCMPSLVGGEVIGSVLVQHPEPLDETATRRIEESITQAAPVLANLRNLALSNTRAMTDGLTGLPNRRSIDDTLKRMLAQAVRGGRPFSVVLFDLDHFKLINDLYGHDKGDEVLAAAGAVISSTVRESDFAGRYGGEEFILLLAEANRDGAVLVAEKLRKAIAAIQIAGVARPITASFGVADIHDDASEPTLLLRAADHALYLAKAQGRNRVAILSDDELELLAVAPASDPAEL